MNALVAILLPFFGQIRPDERPAKPELSFLQPFGEGLTVVPVPSISTSKNEGAAYGMLVALLFEDPHDQHVHTIFAPRFEYNNYLKWTAAGNLFGYPSGDSEYDLFASWSTEIERKFTGRYKRDSLWNEHVGYEIELVHHLSATDRFFGLGPKSRERDESNYTSNHYFGALSLSGNLLSSTKIVFTERLRHFRIQDGALEGDLDQTDDSFPNLIGLHGGRIAAEQISLVCDTRDSQRIPTRGEFLRAYAEIGHWFQSDHSSPFSHYGIDSSVLVPIDSEKFNVLASRLWFQFTEGKDAPFFERSTLGGRNTLRGFGEGRFYDEHLVLMNVELRKRIFYRKLIGTLTELQVAPFIDIGKVYGSFREDLIERFSHRIRVNPGVGVRAVLKPYILARLDMGFSTEGLAIYLGLDYPF